jgi:Na+-translocating membrane potential-generating system (MpsC)
MKLAAVATSDKRDSNSVDYLLEGAWPSSSGLIGTSRTLLEAMVREITGMRTLSLDHDVSTVTSDEVMLFTLTDPPPFRETKRN